MKLEGSRQHNSQSLDPSEGEAGLFQSKKSVEFNWQNHLVFTHFFPATCSKMALDELYMLLEYVVVYGYQGQG